MAFQKDFVWGVATAAYQIEGAAREEGKGLSDWDTFCRKEGNVWLNQTGDVACDHYHRYEEDIAIMKQIGVTGYRMSISWARVMPDGTGKINQRGLDFYDKLIDKLLAAGITPWVTLFHWDYPNELYCRGGWLNPESSDWFAEYAKVIVSRYSDRVTHWMTLNEPQVFINHGHQMGTHAPGLKLGFQDVLRTAHNTLLAHGKGIQTIRAYTKTKCQAGLAPVAVVYTPETDSPGDIDAARKATFTIKTKDTWNNTWWLDPIYMGKYPEDGLKLFGSDVPQYTDKDMKTICQPLDFSGQNIYRGEVVRAGKDGNPEIVKEYDGLPLQAYHWYVMPKSLYWGPKFFYERYKLPIYITENGMANVDWVAVDGKVHDPQRIDFLTRYLRELKKASEDGVKVGGYFQWTLMDNFEWAAGFRERFGIVYTDFLTQKRTLKDSAYWYKDTIAANGANLGK
jgi:beta-glucosidase